MHVLIVATERFVPVEDPVSGIFQYHQAFALHRAGVKVGVLAPAPLTVRSIFKRAKRDRYEEFPFPVSVNRRLTLCPGRFTALMQSMWSRTAEKMLSDYVDRHGRPDLLHAHNAVFAGICCCYLAERTGIPYVITEHSSAFSTGSVCSTDTLREAYRKACARIMVSPFLGSKVEAAIGKDAVPWSFIPNFLEPRFSVQRISPQAVDRTFRFLCVAQFVPIKNHAGLIQAFASAFGGQNVELALGGSGELLEATRALADSCGVSKQVKFLGMLSRDEVIAQMHGCDVLVLPSFSETFGVVLIEALACGKPIIAPSGSGCEAIVNRENGLLFKPGNVKELAQAMVKMVDSAFAYDTQAIRHDCLSRFGEAAVVALMLRTYKEALSNFSRARK